MSTFRNAYIWTSLLAIPAAISLGGFGVSGCAGSGNSDGANKGGSAGSSGGGRAGTGFAGWANGGAGGSCRFEKQTHEDQGEDHVDDNSDVEYNSNPPSSGPHCEDWGVYTNYTPSKPLPRCNYLHNLEHGAIVIAYRCDTECKDTVAALESIRATVSDPACAKVRIIVTPDPLLDVPIAAVAWRTTWKANCLDEAANASLLDFVKTYIGGGLAPEPFVCGDGGIGP